MSTFVGAADQRLAQLQSLGLRRRRVVRQGPAGRHIVLNGRRLLNFSGNDYLGLSNHPALCEAAMHAMQRHGVGSTGSPLVTGFSEPLSALEQHVAAFTGRSRAVVFSSGYLANLSLAQVFCRRGQSVLEDRFNHASLIDSARLASCRLRRYRHADAIDAERKIASIGAARIGLLCTDGVFSMDGDIAPVRQLAELCRRHDVLLAVDDAHGLGVFGPDSDNRGQGSVAAAGLDEQAVPLLCGTFGKAFACAGAFVAGPEPLIELLLQTARSYLFNTAMPPAQAAVAQAALTLSEKESWRREHLFDNIRLFRRQAAAAGLPLSGAPGPIQPLLVGDEKRARTLEQDLRQSGFFVRAMRYPTVARGQARLRVTLSAAHRQEDIGRLVASLRQHGVWHG